ncbi:venom peptide MmKTx1-like [Ixodes scapularis]|uniref:venom peptide MmKTx1-like n=1 Tax=Ixodes scapularis TaxID=6945 RepID=UPI001A9F1341|nr:venom peptide MmKTx1-like [Ixodes scapularis]
MKLPTALLLGLVVSVSILKISLAEPPFSDVQIGDGKCTYGNYTVADGERLNLADPCQRWHCEVESKRFIVLSCMDVIKPPNCELERGTGVYPDCCYRTVCT